MKIRASLFAAAVLAVLTYTSCQKEISFEVNGNPNVDTTGTGGSNGGFNGDLLTRSDLSAVPASNANKASVFYDFDASKRLIQMKTTGTLNGIPTYAYKYYHRDAEGLITLIRINDGDSPDDSTFVKVFRNASKQLKYLLVYDEPAMIYPNDSIAVSYTGSLLKERACYSYLLGTPDTPEPLWKEVATWNNNAISRMNISISWDDATQQWGQQAQLNYEYDNKKQPYDRTLDDVLCDHEMLEGGYSVNNLVKATLQQQVGFPTVPYLNFTMKYGTNNRPSEYSLLFSPPGIDAATAKTVFFYR
ncbi:hypothetical protein [Phnomibacter sp. MR]|uniref:hypothetical protein n=1 Tax=Phnomibacter sp. MR TaxID=3042318 RepID=UPI003A80BCF8